jgi:hypothetical protein
MGNNWNDFSDAEQQTSYDLIPAKTPVKVLMKIRPGGYNDPTQGWTGGFATRKEATGAVYLNAEFTVIGGKYAKRKVFSLIGLYSSKGPEWGKMGRAFIRAALESARGIKADDASERAMKARQIGGFGDLDGLEFCALVDVDKPQDGYEPKNIIQTVIGVGHKDYAGLMDGSGPTPAPAAMAASKPSGGAPKPAWME